MRDKQEVLDAAFAHSCKYGKSSPGITMFRTTDGPAFLQVTVCGSVQHRTETAQSTLRIIDLLNGEPAFSLLPNGGDYNGKRY